ncbi:hypothetical protein ACLOJK_022523 [Asimina triloba]
MEELLHAMVGCSARAKLLADVGEEGAAIVCGDGRFGEMGCCGRTPADVGGRRRRCWQGRADGVGRKTPASDLDLVRRMELKTLDLEGRRTVDGGRRRLDELAGAGRWWRMEEGQRKWGRCHFWVLDFHIMAVLLLEDDDGIEFSMSSLSFWVAWIGHPHHRRKLVAGSHGCRPW